MLNIPVYRWGQPYTSMEVDEVAHFATGEPIARVSRANGGLVQRDMRKAAQAREALRAVPIDDLIDRIVSAGELYLHGELPMGDGTQTPDEFVRAQSATTGLPERLARANMKKNGVRADRTCGGSSTALTRELELDVLTDGHGEERGVPISYQAQSPVLGLVLPSNSPGVHTLWLPVVPLQLGLVLKPGSQEPWTPYRIAEAFFAAGIPREAISIYPGGHDVGAAVLETCGRSMMFGGQAAVDQHRGNPRVQVHGPGFSKILFGDDVVDRWPDYLDLLVESVVDQRRPRLHQRVRHLGQPPHRRDRRRDRQASGGDSCRCRLNIRTRCWRRSPCPARRQRWPRRSMPTPRSRRHRRHGEVSRRRAPRAGRARGVRAADRAALRLAGVAVGAQGVHVPVCQRRPLRRSSDGRGDRSDAGLHGADRTERAASPSARQRARRSVQLRRRCRRRRSTGCSRTKATSSSSCIVRGRSRRRRSAVA